MKRIRWKEGDLCLVTPDDRLPARKVRGVVVSPKKGEQPLLVRCVDDPVWDGCVLAQRGGAGQVRVEPIV